MEDKTDLCVCFEDSLIGLPLNLQDESDNTCLHKAIEENQEATVEKLIIKGAKVDCKDKFWFTPLMLAVQSNKEFIVDLLLKNGASCSVTYPNGLTPLHVAASKNFATIVDKLIEAGADVNAGHADDKAPIFAALTFGYLRIASKLLDKGAYLHSNSVFYSLLYCDDKNFDNLLDFFLKNGFSLNSTVGETKWSFLHFAIYQRNLKMVKNLLKKGASVHTKEKTSERTPLHLACQTSDCEGAIVQLMLDYRSNVNEVDHKGYTALHFAVMSVKPEAVRLLLNAGANMHIINENGNSPLDLSIRWSLRVITSYMLFAKKMDLVKMDINVTQDDRNFHENFTTLSAFEAKCLQELDQMKAKKFVGSSLYSIFSERNDPWFAGNTEMKAYVMSENLIKNFPLYADLLRRMLKEGKIRNTLLKDLNISTRKVEGLIVTHITLPTEISRKVLVFLKHCDLLNAKTAFGINPA